MVFSRYLTLPLIAAIALGVVAAASAEEVEEKVADPAQAAEAASESEPASDKTSPADAATASDDDAELESESESELESESESEPVESGSEPVDHDGESHHGDGDHDADNHDADGHGEGDHGDHGHHDLGHGDASPSLDSPAAFSRDLAIYTFVVFLGLLAVLWRSAWPTITEALEAREKRIEQNIADAEGQLEKAKALVSEHEATMANAADQVRDLLDEARRDADATVARAKSDAKAEFEAERLRATRDIEQASDAAVRQLAEKTAGLAIDLAGRVVKQDISADRQSEIVREALGRFANSDPSAN